MKGLPERATALLLALLLLISGVCPAFADGSTDAGGLTVQETVTPAPTEGTNTPEPLETTMVPTEKPEETELPQETASPKPEETEFPETEAPETEAPETEAPETEAPATEVPETEAPETEAPETEAPETEAPVTEVPATEVPATEEPVQTEVNESDAVTPDEEAPEAAVWSLYRDEGVSAAALEEALAFAAADMTVGIKQKLNVTVSNAPEGAKLKYATSNKRICTVSSKGVVTGVRKGTAQITVTASTGEKATCTVTVVAAPKKIALNTKKATMAVGDTLQLDYAITEGTSATITWSSSKKSVAKVDSNGLVTAVKAGTATITVRTHNGKKATCKITVKKAPASVTAQFTEGTLGVEQRIDDMFAIPAGSYTQMTYSCTVDGVVKMDGDTLVAVAPGTTEITATTHNGHSATAKITVKPAPTSMSISAESMVLAVKQTAVLDVTLPEGTVAGVTYKSSKSKVVKVSADGKLTALRTGTAVITVSTHNGLSKQCKVTVKRAPSKIAMKDTSLVMYIGQQYQEKYTLTKNSVTTLTWQSGNTGVATVNEEGVITAVAEGTTTIKVTTHNGKKDTLKLTVYTPPTYLTIADDTAAMGVKQKLQLKPDTDTTYAKAISFSSSNAKVAKVSGTGLVQALKAGTATITVKSQNGLQDSIEITVYAAPKKVTLPASSITIGVGETYTIVPKITANSYTTLTYSSSSKKYATVSADGVVTGVKPGTAKITVKTHNGKKATLKVKVAAMPGSITLSEDALKLDVGGTAQLTYKLPSGTKSAVTWSSDNTAVCTVDATGVVTCVSKGKANITATTTNGKTDSCAVQVVEPAAALTVTESIEINVGDIAALEIEALTASGDTYAGTVTLTSDDTSIAKILNGEVYGKGAGSCTLQVKASGQTATVQVKVNSIANDSRRDTIVSAAMEKLGCKYVYGNSGPNAFDCAGLVYYAYKQVGITIRYSAYSQGYTVGKQIEVDDLMPGDIVCFNTNDSDTDLSDHTGIYIGSGKFVHASSGGGKVMVSTLTSGYYQRTFSWGRRVLTSSN